VLRFDKWFFAFAGCQGGVDGWLPQLADVAVSVPDAGGELEEQVLRGGELGNDACVWQGQHQDWLTRCISFKLVSEIVHGSERLVCHFCSFVCNSTRAERFALASILSLDIR